MMRGIWKKTALLVGASLTLLTFIYSRLPSSTAQSVASLNLPFVASDEDAVSIPREGAPTYTYNIINSWSHDRGAFTQGLIFHNGQLYESTGLYGRSSLRKVELTTGKVLQKVDVGNQYFAEGMTLLGNKLYQLTWQNGVGFVYDLNSFALQRQWRYQGEGWGLTTDQKSLIMSDGSNQIRFIDPATFAVQRTINILDRGQPVLNLNELEYIKGEIYANIWQTDRVVRIHPRTGTILGWVDLTGLLGSADRDQAVDVLNGIAYDAVADRLFVTGKLWPKLFEIRLERQRSRPRPQVTTPIPAP